MLAGTLGGISFGVLVAYPISQWLKTNVSAVCAGLGMPIGWTVSWLVARRIPREARLSLTAPVTPAAQTHPRLN
jgi:hypothetical protein